MDCAESETPKIGGCSTELMLTFGRDEANQKPESFG